MRQRPKHVRSQRRFAAAHGFTLIEASLAMVIIGVGVVSAVRLFAACAQDNRASNQMTAAMHLAGHVRETMAGLPFDDPIFGSTNYGEEPGETVATYNDIDDFDGRTFSPPIDSMRQAIPSMSQYSQIVDVSPVFPNKLNANTNDAVPEISKGTYTGALRVRVRIMYRLTPSQPAAEVYRTSWVRLDN